MSSKYEKENKAQEDPTGGKNKREKKQLQKEGRTRQGLLAKEATAEVMTRQGLKAQEKRRDGPTGLKTFFHMSVG